MLGLFCGDISASRKSIRRSILWYQEMYEKGEQSNNLKLQQPLRDLLKAWERIQTKSFTSEDSFFNIASFHGITSTIDSLKNSNSSMNDSSYIGPGGYCNHGNILFPTWHRLYVREIEKALQEYNPTIGMPFWDATDEFSLRNGIPWVLTKETITFLDDFTIKNPLVCFTFPAKISVYKDDENNNNLAMQARGKNFTKDVGYSTVRYPYSGLNTPNALDHNKKINLDYYSRDNVTETLNDNIVQWLTGTSPERSRSRSNTNPLPSIDLYDRDNYNDNSKIYCTDKLFKSCLLIDNYIVFSNTTSAAAYNAKNVGKNIAISLEKPHNDIHLSIGGFTVHFNDTKGIPNYQIDGIIEGANGDMGENETASFDPIFFFHHCNIDRIFWLWQIKHGKISKESLLKDYDSFVSEYVQSFHPISPNLGLSTTDLLGPSVTFSWNEKIDFNTPLVPFRKSGGFYYTSNDVWNIADLNYSYENGSLMNESVYNYQSVLTLSYWYPKVKKSLQVDILRGNISGSILIQAFIKNESGKWEYLGHHSILSRWIVDACTNCQKTLCISMFFQLPDYIVDLYNKNLKNTIDVNIIIKTRQGVIHNAFIMPINKINSNMTNDFNPPWPLTKVRII